MAKLNSDIGRVKLFLLAVGIFIGGIVAFGGYLVSQYQVFPFSYMNMAEQAFKGLYRAAIPAERPTHKQLSAESIFLRLQGDGVLVPVALPARGGGGMTSFGDSVVLITREGTLFSARSARDLELLNIEAPDNGWRAYAALADSPQYSEYKIHPQVIRYNDVEFFKTSDGKGLAISYTEFNESNKCYQTTVATLEFDIDIEDIREVVAARDDWQVLFRTKPCLPLKKEYTAIEGHMAGGRLAFEGPSTLYLASGDYAWDGVYAPKAIAQDPAADYGKVIAIDIGNKQATTLSLGHRNTQGIGFTEDGRLWVVEHGMRGGDELNAIYAGGNFGWPEETLGTAYSKTPWPLADSYGRHEKFDRPVFAWLPSVATSSITLIDGFSESWDGDLLVGSLKDQSLYRIRINGDSALFVERVFIGERIRDVHQHSDGRLVLWTDSSYLYFVDESEISYVAEFISDYINEDRYDEPTANRVRAAIDSCMECHSFDHNDDVGAPSLGGVFGRAIAGTDYAGYSDALASKGGRWSRENLIAFVRNPSAFVPGTTMPDTGIEEPLVAEEVVNILEALRQTAE